MNEKKPSTLAQKQAKSLISIFKQKDLIKFFYSYQRKHLGMAAIAGILLFINVLLQLPMPLVTRYLIDTIIPAKNFKALNLLCLLLLGIIVISQLSTFLMRYIIAKYKARVHFAIESDLYFHVQDLPLSYFSKRPSGYILSRINEVSSIEAVMADTFLYMIRDIVTMLVGTVLILNLHFKLGMVSLAVLPFFVLAIKKFHKKIKAITQKLREEGAQYTGKLEKNINSIEKIKSAVKESSTGQRIADKLTSVINLGIKAEILNGFATVVSGFIGMISPFVVLWFGVSEIMNGNLTLGTFVAINSFLGYLYQPARRLTDVGYNLSRAMASLERVYSVFQEKEEVKEGEPAPTIDDIRFENVHFSYDGNKQVLQGLNLHIKKGQKVAIVGESGQGKSTLVKMLMKFYLPDSGHVLFSGKDANEIAVASLRRKIAYISQRQRILEDDLKETIDSPGVRDMLQKFKLEKAIDAKDIFQTEFSGGEIQKVELMESILREADVLIVDEGTSNIDYNSEKIILEELFSTYSDKIIIFIAHRLSSITGFEKILVIDKGRVAEQGSHTQLLGNNGKYRFLWGTTTNHTNQTGKPGTASPVTLQSTNNKN